MNLIQVVLGVSGYRHANVFARRCADPLKTQETLLKRILEVNASTVYGEAHGFGSIKTIQDYQKAVPANSYDDLEPYIQRAARGEPKQLTADPPILFATTSGTTGTPKFIPITKTSRRDKSMAMRLWLYHASSAHPKMFDGQILAVVSPEIEGYTESGIPYGAESGHAYKNMPSIMKTVYAIPYEVFAMTDYSAKYYCLLLLAVSKNISVIATCNPSTILLLAKRSQEWQEQIVRDIRNGEVDPGLDIPSEVRALVEDQIGADLGRARFLEECIEREGRLLPKDVWPNLALIGCWKGGSVGLYLREFDGLFDPATPRRDWGYLASEVRGSLPITDEGCGGVLTLETNFFEFVDENEIDSDHRVFLTADQLEDGRRYFVFPTTTGGLYRYEMNDLVRVNGFYEKTPIIEFIQKGKGVSSLTGEKLYEAQVCTAVSRCHDALGGPFEFVVAAPEWGAPPRYVFLVEETEEDIPSPRWRSWIQAIDRELREENEEYDTKRKSLRLNPPAAKVLKRGEFIRYRRKRVAEGAPDGQFKMLKLNPDMEFPKEFEVDRVVEMEDH